MEEKTEKEQNNKEEELPKKNEENIIHPTPNPEMNFSSSLNKYNNQYNSCFKIDNFFINIFNPFIQFLEYIFIPIKYCLKIPFSQLERPYVFILLLNFFILMTPAILFSIGYIQSKNIIFFSNSTEETDKESINVIFSILYLIVLLLTIVNYYSSFVLYSLYGIHKVHQRKKNYNVKSFVQYIQFYLFIETNFGYFMIYWLIQIIPLFFIENYANNLIQKQKEILNVEVQTNEKGIYKYIVLASFLRFGSICNLVFIFLHIGIYLTLFFVILCKINGSCLCLIATQSFCSHCYEDITDSIIQNTENSNAEVSKIEIKDNNSENIKNENNTKNSQENQIEAVIEYNQNEETSKTKKNIEYKTPKKSLHKKIPSKISLDEEITNEKPNKKQLKYRVSKNQGVLYNDAISVNSGSIVRTIPFVEKMISFFKFMKIFDYEKELGEGESILGEI